MKEGEMKREMWMDKRKVRWKKEGSEGRRVRQTGEEWKEAVRDGRRNIHRSKPN